MRLSLSKTFTLSALAAGAFMAAVATAPVAAQAQPRGWGHHHGWRGGPRYYRPRVYGARPWGPAYGYYVAPRRCVVRWRWADTPWGWRRVRVRRCW